MDETASTLNRWFDLGDPFCADNILKTQIYRVALMVVLDFEKAVKGYCGYHLADPSLYSSAMDHDLPLRSHQLFHTHDVDHAREQVARVFCPHQLTPVGRTPSLDARHHSFKLGQSVSLNYVQYGPAVTIDPGYLEHFYLLQIPLRGHAHIRNGGRTVDSHTGLASLPAPTESLFMRWEDDSPHLIVQISRQGLERHWEQLSQKSLCGRALVFQLDVDFRQPALHNLLGFIHHLCHVAEQPSGFAHPLLADQAQQYLMSSLLLNQSHNHTGTVGHESSMSVLPRSVRRARDYLHANAQHAVSLADICEHAGVSARTLQMAFRSHFGQTPLAYLRDVRLDKVHRHLQQASAEETTVTEVATSHGFMHLGHFAAHYQQRFGEPPHKTLQANRTVIQVAPPLC